MKMRELKYKTVASIGDSRYDDRVDVYLANEDGSTGQWLGTLIKDQEGKFHQHGLIPNEIRPAVEARLGS